MGISSMGPSPGHAAACKTIREGGKGPGFHRETRTSASDILWGDVGLSQELPGNREIETLGHGSEFDSCGCNFLQRLSSGVPRALQAVCRQIVALPGARWPQGQSPAALHATPPSDTSGGNFLPCVQFPFGESRHPLSYV